MSTASQVRQENPLLQLLVRPTLLLLALVLSEWLFLATKPSFMSAMGVAEKLLVLLAGLLMAAVAMAWLVLALALLLQLFGRAGPALLRALLAALSAALLLMLAVMLADNFLYTVFGIGIRSIPTKMFASLVAVPLFVIYAVLFLNYLKGQGPVPRIWGSKGSLLTSLLLVVLVPLALLPRSRWLESHLGVTGEVPSRNIILIGVDALEAAHLSVYGYHRDTTPFLDSRKEEFLLSRTSYSNNAKTFGAVASMLNGKYPTTTRLIYPPDTLTGLDQFQHLPGILGSHGYRSLDMSLRWYADPEDMNLRCAFNEANLRVLPDCRRMSLAMESLLLGFAGPVVLLERARERISERLAILNPWSGVDPVPDKLSRAGQPLAYWYSDEARIAAAVRLIRQPDERPFFINLHLMGAHGPQYLLRDTVFSDGRRQAVAWEDDFYDDAIIGVDRDIASLFQALEETGKLESTIIVVTSDHGRDWDLSAPMPLMIRFPGAVHAGVLTGNTHRLDVAPTLMEYLGMGIPSWMEGNSLLSLTPEALENRVIFQSFPSSNFKALKDGAVVMDKLSAPFYALGGVNIIHCDVAYTWNLEQNSWGHIEIGADAGKCRPGVVRKPGEYLALATDHLVARGYEPRVVQDMAGTVDTREVE